MQRHFHFTVHMHTTKHTYVQENILVYSPAAVDRCLDENFQWFVIQLKHNSTENEKEKEKKD